MTRWISIEIKNGKELKDFVTELNKSVLKHSNNVYFKVFTPKNKILKNTIFYIADEGSKVIENLETRFNLVKSVAPERKLITRVAGFSADRECMTN